MQAPITSVERIISALPANQINAGGSSFCQPFNSLTSKFPFKLAWKAMKSPSMDVA